LEKWGNSLLILDEWHELKTIEIGAGLLKKRMSGTCQLPVEKHPDNYRDNYPDSTRKHGRFY